MQAVVSWLLGNGYHSNNKLKTAQAKTSPGTFLIPALSGQQKAPWPFTCSGKKSYVLGYKTRDWGAERKRRMVLSPSSKPDLCRRALNMCGAAGCHCILSPGTKKFPFKILLVKTEKWLCSCRMQPGCLGPFPKIQPEDQCPIWKPSPFLTSATGSKPSHLSKVSGLCGLPFPPIFEGFLSCLCRQKYRIHGVRRRKQAREPE